MNGKNKIFGDWNKERSYPEPFSHISEKRVQIAGITTGAKGDYIGVIEPLVWAITKIAKKQAGEDVSPEYLAIGTKSSAEGEAEEIFVEYQSETEVSEGKVQLIAYDPNTGNLRGTVVNLSNQRYDAYKLAAVTKREYAPDKEALWAALFWAALSDRETQAAYDAFQRALAAGEVEEAFSEAAVLSWLMYEKLLSGDIAANVEDSQGMLKKLTKDMVESGSVAPGKGKGVFSDSYKVFKLEKGTLKAASVIAIAEGQFQDIPWEKSVLTPEEELLIPAGADWYIPGQYHIRAINYLYLSKKFPHGDVTKVMSLIGGAGCGKSTITEMIASKKYGLNRPFLRHICNSNSTADELKGVVLPVVNEVSQNVPQRIRDLYDLMMSTDADELFDKMAEKLGLPQTVDIFFDHEDAYTQMTGLPSPKYLTPADCYSMLNTRIMAAQQEVQSALKGSATGDVEYKFFESNILKAMRNGYIIEIAEIGNIKDPGAFTDFNDALDESSSTRIVQTPYGICQVHPDTIILATMNRGYAANHRIDEAVLDRITKHCIEVPEPTPEETIARCSSKLGVTDMKLLSECYKVYEVIRERQEDDSLGGVISPRHFYSFVQDIVNGVPKKDAVEDCLINGIALTDKETKAILRQEIENLDFIEEDDDVL